MFYWSSTPTLQNNGGTIIGNGQGAWIRIYSGPLNVKWFGAKGDGSVDDRPAIQAAIDVCALAGGGVVQLPAGTYIVGYGLAVKTRVHLRGAGTGGKDTSSVRSDCTTIKLAANSSPPPEAIAAYLGNVITLFKVIGARVSDLVVDGNRANNSSQSPVLDASLASWRGGIRIGGIEFTSERSCDCLLENVRVVECGTEGIKMASALRCTALRCYSSGHGTVAWGVDANAILIADYCDNCDIIDCDGWECVHGGIEIFVNYNMDTKDVSGHRNSIQRCRTDNIILNTGCIDAAPSPKVLIADNIIDSRNTLRPAGSRKGIVVACLGSDVVIKGNTIYCGDGDGISVGNGGVALDSARNNCSKNIQIVDNHLSRDPADAPAYAPFTGVAIALQQVDDCTIAGNNLSGTWGYGIYANDCRGLQILGNCLVGRSADVPNYYAPEDDSRELSFTDRLPDIGMELQAVDDSLIQGNFVRGYKVGAIAEVQFHGSAGPEAFSKRNVVIGNNLRHNWRSVYPLTGSNEAAPQMAPSSIWTNNKLRAP